MTRSVFVTSAEGETGKSTVAYGLLDLLSRQAGRIAIFRPVAIPRPVAISRPVATSTHLAPRVPAYASQRTDPRRTV